MSTWDCDKCTFLNSNDSLTCIMCYQVRASTRALPYTWQWLAQVDWIPYDGPSNEQLERAYQSKAAKCDLTKGWFAGKVGEYTVHFGTRPARPIASTIRSHIHSAIAAVGHAVSSVTSGSPPASQGDDEDDEDDGDDDVDDNASMASHGSATAAPATSAPTSSSAEPPVMVPAFTQINNHSHMVRKVRRLANDDDAMFTVIPPSKTQRDERCSICRMEWWEEDEEDAKPTAAAATTASTVPTKTPSSTGGLSSTAMDTAMSPKKPVKTSSALLSSSTSGSSTVATATSPATSSDDTTCLARFPDDRWSDANQANVKLAKCANGHSFHRECIASWIKLKDHCPFCSKKI